MMKSSKFMTQLHYEKTAVYTQISQSKISFSYFFIFYTENTLLKLLCEPKDREATEDKNNIVYEIGYFNESNGL